MTSATAPNRDPDLVRRKMEEDFRKARQIQELLMPTHVPDMDGAALGFMNLPIHDLSGDFLDFFYKRTSNEIGFFVCDVSGHGVAAALLAAMVKMSLQRWGEYLSEPAGTLRKVHGALADKLGDNFVTAVMGYLDMTTGTLRVGRAGHEPPLLIRARSGTAELIEPTGAIIHQSIPCNYEEYETVIEPGDRIFLFTDGITEARSLAGAQLETEGLEQILARHRNASAQELCDAIILDVMGFTGSDEGLSDDITMMAVEYTNRC